MRAIDCKEGLGFAQSINVAWYFIRCVDVQAIAVVSIKVDRQAYQVGQGHPQIHERYVQKDLPGPRSSLLEEDVGEYGVPFVSKLPTHRCLAQGSMFSKGVDV